MRYYVYALIDPTRGNAPFYIGKGLDSRLQSHFRAVDRLAAQGDLQVVGCDTRSVLDAASADGPGERLARILDLKRQGIDHTHVARIVARRMDEPTAFAPSRRS